jgi:mono/diheme cytochrome c family protein
MPADDPIRRYVVSTAQVRLAYVLGGIGAVSLIIAVLILATARPQGAYAAVDATQHQAALDRADAALRGFEVRDDGSARIDIDHAMRLVAERGVDLTVAAAAAAPGTDAAADGAPGDGAAAAVPDGVRLYAQHCSACHMATGAGIPGAFPPIADHVGELVAADRSYPAKVVLFGLAGAITVNGTAYNGLMPAIGAGLQDDEVAAILEYVLNAWGDITVLGDAHTPYTAEEVAEWRALGLSPGDVLALRQTLPLP